MKDLIIDSFHDWISNDPNKWWIFSVNYAEWVELREDSKKITLSKGTPDSNYMWPSTTAIMWYDVVDADKLIRIHLDWIVTNYLEKNIFGWVIDWNSIIDLWEPLYNIWSLTTPVWRYGFIMWATKVYKRVYDSTSASLWIYNTSWIVTTPTFSSATWWTVWAWWAISWWLATHTAWWWTNTLSQTTALTTVTSQVYRVKVVCGTITADSCNIRLWWVSQYSFDSSDSGKTVVFLYTAAWTTTALDFSPFNAFAWSFDSVEVYQYNITEQAQTFNTKAPYIVINNFIYVWNWSIITEIDTTTSTWVFTDVLTIDLDFNIKWITKIGDQVNIYASNGNSSRKYLWNWVDTTVNGVINWTDKNVVNIANFANQDYAITKSAFSNKSGLYLVNWYNLDKLYENIANLDETKERIYFDADYTNAIETIGNKLLVPWIDWIYSYWNHTPWLSRALVKEYLHQTGQTTAMYYSETSEFQLKNATIWTFNWTTWVWETTYNFYNISYWNNPNYSWFVILQPLYWDIFSNVKNFEKIVTWYELWTGCQIIYYTKNINDAIKYATIAYNYTTIPAVWDTYTFNSNTFTITAITDLGDYCILHTTYTWTWAIPNKWTFTRTAWVWDSSFTSNKIRYWFKYIWVITDTAEYKSAITHADGFNKKFIAFEFVNTNIAFNTNTPAIYDINLYYDEKRDE